MKGKTYYEDGVYYSVIMLPNGHEYYGNGCKSRSTAYRISVKETAKYKFAEDNGMIYNTRGL